MTETEPVTMTDDECDALLARRASGVLSLTTASDEPPHTFPVSFGYDSMTSTFYFRLADADSQKGELAGRPASFVTYDHDQEYQSVVASGTLESTTDEKGGTEVLAGFERVTIPYVDIHGEPPAEVEFEFYRLVADRLTGRKETTTEL